VVHDRRIEDRELTLGVSGKLIDGNLVMYDAETDSLFLQATGEGLEGSLGGSQLQELPTESWGVVRWGEWRQRHPDTLILSCAHCEGTGEAAGTIDELHREAHVPPPDETSD
jgi:hypothetical protein